MLRISMIALVALSISACASTTDPNYDDDGNYVGCHGVGCLVDPVEPDGTYIDPRPQFDNDGNPNFDTQGNWIGCPGPRCD